MPEQKQPDNRIVEVQPATTSAPLRYIYADGRVVEIHDGPRQVNTNDQFNAAWEWKSRNFRSEEYLFGE